MAWPRFKRDLRKREISAGQIVWLTTIRNLVAAVWWFGGPQSRPDRPPAPEPPVPRRHHVPVPGHCRPVFQVNAEAVAFGSVQGVCDGGEEAGRLSRYERHGAAIMGA